ncbi:MAG: hypothetical protein HY659_08750 [Rhizobiales bacterium]|nr:hypothetical protein [Hyphomicrobiales bacterium]
MRHLPNALHIIAGAIALYFALVWGADAVRILASPIYGFEDSSFARVVYGVGRLFGLGPMGLANAAAFLAALKLAVAIVFMLLVLDRVHCLRGRNPDHEMLQAALLLLLLSAEIVGVSAALGGAKNIASLPSAQLFLAGAITALSLFERRGERVIKIRVERLDAERGYVLRSV